MKRKPNQESKLTFRLCGGVLFGLGLSVAVSFFGAWLAMKSADPLSHAGAVALAALGAGGFFSSFFCGRQGKSVVSGLVGGACFLLVMLFTSLFGSSAGGFERGMAFGVTAISVLAGAFLSVKRGNSGKKRLKKLGLKR